MELDSSSGKLALFFALISMLPVIISLDLFSSIAEAFPWSFGVFFALAIIGFYLLFPLFSVPALILSIIIIYKKMKHEGRFSIFAALALVISLMAMVFASIALLYQLNHPLWS